MDRPRYISSLQNHYRFLIESCEGNNVKILYLEDLFLVYMLTMVTTIPRLALCEILPERFSIHHEYISFEINDESVALVRTLICLIF